MEENPAKNHYAQLNQGEENEMVSLISLCLSQLGAEDATCSAIKSCAVVDSGGALTAEMSSLKGNLFQQEESCMCPLDLAGYPFQHGVAWQIINVAL